VNHIKVQINNLYNNGHISEKILKWILQEIDLSKLGSFRLLAKLHKPKFSWRPIINCKNHPNKNICLIIDLLLQPIVRRTETYIKDSQHLIQKLKDVQFENEPLLYSLDIVSLYTNINPTDATYKITDFMNNYINSSNINIVALNIFLKIMFDTNVFKYERSFYKQIKGLPMGCICGPSVANLYVYILEIKWFHIEKPLSYHRFIDDTQIILDKKLNLIEFQKYFGNLEFTESTGKTIIFLDLIIGYNKSNKKLTFSVHLKPTNSFNYVRTNSNHPKHVFNNIPGCLFVRNRKICTYYSDYISISCIHISGLLKRGYNKISLIKLCKTIGNIDRNSLLPYKENKNNFLSSKHNSILYFQIFNYNLNFKSILYNYFSHYINNFNLIYINKVNTNLNNALVHNQSLLKIYKYKTSKCNEKNCNICKFIYDKHYVNLEKNYDLKIKLMNNATCLTDNIIYIIICLKCNIFYIGETCKTLKERFKQHLNYILNFKPYKKYHDKEVPRHFRSNNHKLSDIKVCVFKSGFNDTLKRKHLELDLINI
jgi:hypothetical protein